MSSEYKSISKAYCYWLFGCCGTLGCQRCYLDDTFGGVAFCTTFGVCGFGALYDLLCLSCQVTEYNDNIVKNSSKTTFEKEDIHGYSSKMQGVEGFEELAKELNDRL